MSLEARERLGSGRSGGFDSGKPGCWARDLEAAPAAPGAVGSTARPGRERARWRPDGGWTRCPEPSVRVPIVRLLIRSPTVESGAEPWSQTPCDQQPQTRRTSAKHGPRVLSHSNTLSKRLHSGLVKAKISILQVLIKEPTKSQLDIPLYCWFANSINSIVGR